MPKRMMLLTVMCVLLFAVPVRAVDDLPLTMVPVLAATTGVDGSDILIADPYISSARLCEDENNNGACDTGEQLSTLSDASGKCSFAARLKVGSTIISASSSGTHLGVPYPIALARKIERGMSGTIVVSPLTTLAATGMTAAQVADILDDHGDYVGLTAAMVTQDPMAGLDTLAGTSVTDASLLPLRANLAAMLLLYMRSGSATLSAMTGAQLYQSGKGSLHQDAVYSIFNTCEIVTSNVIDHIHCDYTNMDSMYDDLPSGAPHPVAGDLARTGAVIMLRLAKVGYDNCIGGASWLGALVSIQDTYSNNNGNDEWTIQIGRRYYGFRNKTYLNSGLVLWYLEGLRENYVAGRDSTVGDWYIDSSELVQEVP